MLNKLRAHMLYRLLEWYMDSIDTNYVPKDVRDCGLDEVRRYRGERYLAAHRVRTHVGVDFRVG